MVKVTTTNPQHVLDAMKKKIADGGIRTWQVSTQGYFTHTADQWKNRAWFKNSIRDNDLVFNIVRPKGKNVSKTIYAVYHGRFLEMLLAHFDSELSNIRVTSLASKGDIV